jgi:predicted RNA-binding protein with PUA-like domain
MWSSQRTYQARNEIKKIQNFKNTAVLH